MVWDVCSWRDMGPLIRLEMTLTGNRYLSIHVHCAFRRIGTIPGGQCDTPRVESCYQVAPEHSSDFRHFHWPRKSPEMNIIEDIRDALLHAVENRSPPPRTPMDLWTILKDEWCELPSRYIQTLVESMLHRVVALLCVRGALHDIRQVYQFSSSM
ncbi:hypothetical protein AVEN_179200-1 [Araneus ventricosus]|uniref:Tc1-like transposase DDE domain-containing protein n=1 Tax=Araneus ventricosus TaxID=182803 RepID=A0A4Y2C7P6_ARAVE|nr:hypothetical protein AVEN_179200-1 [Araneus ventricosus]